MSYTYINMAKPVKVDKEYEAEIDDISRRGNGIAGIQGLVIFVPNTKQGEQVKFKVIKVGNSFAIGELAQA